MDCLLLLGGNVGDRKRRLSRARSALGRLPASRVLAVSRVYQTAPIGPSRRPFYNQAVLFRTPLSPMGLLIECKRLESEAGRRPGPRWGPRPLDIDVLSYGKRAIRTPWLTVPHPRAARRAFVLAPVADIAPGWRPDGRSTAKDLLRRLNPRPGTVKIVDDA